MERIYLDHAATSPTHPKVVDAMLPFFTERYGNPSSIHSFGRDARQALDQARGVIAGSIHAKPNEMVFTSGGTEADNMALLGTAYANKGRGNHIITTEIEHHAVLNTCKNLENEGFDVTYLPVNEQGLISLDELKEALTDNTILVSIMYGNNEVGTIQPIKEIGDIVAETDAYFHTDAVQAYGFYPIDVKEWNIDLLSVSSHKINGPRGVGFLYVKDGVKWSPSMFGGEQERKRRPGTENVASIYGFKAAVELAAETMEQKKAQYQLFTDMFIDMFSKAEIDFQLNANAVDTLPHILNVHFPGINLESMLVNLDMSGIAASSGSACTAGSVDPSHVLTAMYGKGNERAQTSIRFSFGYGNTEEQITQAAEQTIKIVKRLTK